MHETWTGHAADTSVRVPEWFVEAIHTALQHLYDPTALRASPLLKLFRIGLEDHPASALRRILLAAVEARKPDASVPLQSNAWREYHILYFRFVEQALQGQVAADLGLSTRHVRRHERRALEVLANDLWHCYRPSDPPAPADAASPPSPAPSGAPQTPSYEDEIHWLQMSHVMEHVDVAQLLETTAARVASLAQAQGAVIEVIAPEDVPPVAVQAAPTRQALANLLICAAQSADKGVLRLSAEVDADFIAIQIAAVGDNGKPPAHLTLAQDQLVIAEKLVQLSGGRIAQVSGSASHGQPQIQIHLPAANSITVLAIDDNPDTLRLLTRYVSGTRYRLVTVEDPLLALEMAQTTQPDIITIDVMLPGMDGWDLLGRLRGEPNLHHVPVIVCTILPQDQLAYSLGADSFLRKPVSRDEFLLVLDRVRFSLRAKRMTDVVDHR